MIVVLCDLIADLMLQLPSMPVQAGDIHRLSHLDIGPGGACNIAIMAARFGLDVHCLGEVGDDRFGEVVLNGLKKEGCDISGITITAGGSTPVAGVLIDTTAEPAYLGHPGKLQVKSMPEEWRKAIAKAEAVFADGWAEYDFVPSIILEAFHAAQAAGVPVFFDPGPGNPDIDNSWWQTTIELATVVLLNQAEASKITGKADAVEAGEELISRGPQLVVLKRGAEGVIIFDKESHHSSTAFTVDVVDTTGAGDSLTGATLYSYLQKRTLEETVVLANATGAAKVQKLGTGHYLPTLNEIKQVLQSNNVKTELLPN